MEHIPNLILKLTSFNKTGMFYVPKFFMNQGYLEIGKVYRLTIEEVK